ncbi:hypothetical protein [Candidatus Nitrosocosmicus hydrocola]|uniref:hypothetical protein n=1 Tax=Candidatus Nitrosocosmicus hydrocola TaxID=1826872 RepID=UPI001372D800|nr:hypothetical protein [Candidatus Nitrosocosmicus hydrocola]
MSSAREPDTDFHDKKIRTFHTDDNIIIRRTRVSSFTDSRQPINLFWRGSS